MVDITVDSTATGTAGKLKFLWGPYWADDSVAAIVGINSSDDPTIYRTTNGGSSWTETALDATTASTVACWYDAETPGLTTKLLHMVWPDIDNDSFDYLNLNLETGVYSNSGTPYTIASTAIGFGNSECFITRTRNGNLIAGFWESSTPVSGTYRSTDTGANWTGRTNVWESTSEDEILGVTVNTGDGADAGVVYWDYSADEISIKVYDDSANAWNETSVSGSMTNPTVTTYRNFSVGTFRSNGKAFLAAFSESDTATADLKTWLLDITSVSAGAAGVSAKTDVLTNTAEAICPAVFIDPRTDEIYVNYLTGTAANSLVNPFYKKSSDTGTSWGSAVALSDAAEDDYRGLSAGACFSNGGKNMPVWGDDDDDDFLTSVFADVVLTSDVLVEGSPASLIDRTGIWGPYWVSPSIGAMVYLNSAQDVVATKTTDGGQTWSAATAAEAGTVNATAAFFDGDVPGDTGDGIHVAWADSTAGDFTYARFDIGDGTWSTPVDIDAAVAFSASFGNNQLFIAKTRAAGFVAGWVITATASGCYKSADGSSWSSIANPYESNVHDFCLGVSVDTGDTADSGVIFWDKSTDEISVKMYDDSANTWTETAIGSSMVEVGASIWYNFAVRTRRSDGHTILVAWNGEDTLNNDLKVWDLTLNSIAAPTVTAKTDAVANSSEASLCGIFIDQSNDDLYVVYGRGTSWTATVHIYYVKSTDDGATWGSEQSYSQQIEEDWRFVFGGAMGDSSLGGRFMPAWYDDDDDDIFVNYNNSVSIAAVGGGDPEGALLHSKLLNGGLLVNRGVLVG